MRIFVTVLTLALLAAWNPVTTAQAQPCEPSNCWKGAKKAGSAKAAKKPAAVKKMKKPKEEYMRAAN